MKAAQWTTFLARRDEATFAPVYEAAKALVYTICRRLTADEDEALEAFQSTWARLLAEARQGEVPKAMEPLGYLSRLAVREADALRQRSRRRAVREVLMEELPEQTDAAASAREAIAAGQTGEILRTLVDDLPERLRVPVQMHYFDGLTHRQIAEALGVPQGTISYRIAEAHKRLEPLCRRAGIESAAGALATMAGTATLMLPPASATAASVFAAAGGGTAAAATASGGFVLTKGAVAMVAGVVMGLLLVLSGTTAYFLPNTATPPPVAASAGSPATGTSATGAPVEAPPAPPQQPKQAADAPVDAGTTQEAPTQTVPQTPATEVQLTLRWTDNNEPVTGATLTRLGTDGRVVPGDQPLELLGEYPVALTPSSSAPFIEVAHPQAEGGRQRFTLPERGALNARLKPAAVVYGTVVDADTSAPLAGATVVLGQHTGPVSTTTHSDGSFVIPAEKGGYMLYATHGQKTSVARKGESFLRLPPGRRNGPFTLRVREGAFLSVLVLDAQTKLPVEGAKVVSELGEVRVTDQDGTARFDAMTREEWQVQVTAEGYAAERRAASLTTVGDSVLEVQLSPGGTIRGRVRDESGQPLEGVQVRASLNGPMTFVRTCSSDEQGRFELSSFPLEKEITGILFEKEGFAPGWINPYPIPAATKVVEKDVVLKRGFPLSGVVVDHLGKPVLGARVEYGHQASAEHREAQTGADGRFTLLGVSGSSFSNTLLASADGYAPTRVAVDPLPTTPVTLTLQPGKSIRGRVVDELGSPIAGVSVIPVLNVSGGDHTLAWFTTKADGLFEFHRASEQVRFTFLADGWSEKRDQELPLGRQELVDVVMHPEALISGMVVDAESKAPIAQYNLKVHGKGLEFSRSTRGVEIYDDAGRFAAKELIAGESYRVTISADGYIPAETEVVAQPAAEAREVVVELSRPTAEKELTVKAPGMK